MNKDKPRRLDEVVYSFAPEGANDVAWFMVEHQIVQLKMSAQVVVAALEEIIALPENANERGIATDCMDITRMLLRHILDHYATFLSYLSDTDVPERISRKEL